MTRTRLITIIVVFLIFDAIVATVLFFNLDLSNSGSSQQEVPAGQGRSCSPPWSQLSPHTAVLWLATVRSN